MFEHFVSTLGQPANETGQSFATADIRLATAVLLFAMLPVDYEVKAVEGAALTPALQRLFAIHAANARRLVARAASAHGKGNTVLSAATLLKLRTPLPFRAAVAHELRHLAQADGVIHMNELDHIQRVERLLGLDDGAQEARQPA